MFKVGQFVTRKSYGNDVVFMITDIKNNVCYLQGVSVRLFADSPIGDLVKCDGKELDVFSPDIDDYRILDREDYFYLPGKILHLDGSKEYLSKCLNFYKHNKLKAFGKYLPESQFAEEVFALLEKYKPNILVLTGHDAATKRGNNEKYKNTGYFVNAVREARRYEKSHEKLLIIAGACQSDYEDLIKAGANFASSPKRVNIHALDPAIIASCLAFSNINKDIDLIKILGKTKYGSDGIGGIITKGTMYVGYPR